MKEVMLDGGALQSVFYPDGNMCCGNSTNYEIFEKTKCLFDENIEIFTEKNTFERILKKMSREMKKLQIPSCEKREIYSHLNSLRAQTKYKGFCEIDLGDYEVQIGIINILSKNEKEIVLEKYNGDDPKNPLILKKSTNKNFEKILKNHCDKDDTELLSAAYYGNTSWLVTTDERIDKSGNIYYLFPVFHIHDLKKDEIEKLKYLNQYGLIEYAKNFWKRICKRVKTRDKSRKI